MFKILKRIVQDIPWATMQFCIYIGYVVVACIAIALACIPTIAAISFDAWYFFLFYIPIMIGIIASVGKDGWSSGD